MNRERFITLFDYNYWARDRILAAMAGLSEADFARDNGFTYGSIRAMLAHALDAEYGWRHRFEGMARTATITPEDVASPDVLAERWRTEEQAMRRWLKALTNDRLAGDLVWTDRSGTEQRLPNLWLSVAHVINHTTQHRSEAAEALTMIGRSPGDLDLGTFAHSV